MLVDWIKKIWDYNYWAHHKMLDCAAQLSKDDFEKPVDYSMGSVHQQLIHVMWAEWIWYSRIHKLPRPDFTTEDYPTIEALREKWVEIEASWRAYLNGLTDADLGTLIHYSRQNGETLDNPLCEILWHVVNHGTDHRAQILQLCHTYGAPTFEQDMFFYYRALKNNPG